MTTDAHYMAMAVDAAMGARHRASPNPWVGAVIVGTDGTVATGATRSHGGAHAEVDALSKTADAAGATIYSTLEPCNHTGRTGPCTDALIDAGVRRVVIGIEDPDPKVAGTGSARLRDVGIEVETGVGADAITRQLRPYLHHRASGRPWVVLKLAATLDGRTAAPDGTSQWITHAEARVDVHRLRAESDAIVVGAGTVRADDPALTARDWPGPGDEIDPGEVRDPRRVVLGAAPTGARVHPCEQWDGSLPELLDRLGGEGVVQLLVEGGATVARSFHAAGLVDQHVVYLAPALFGGDDGAPVFRGPGAATLAEVWRGEIDEVRRIGPDLRIDLVGPDSIGAGGAAR